jgi:hypothetical protein
MTRRRMPSSPAHTPRYPIRAVVRLTGLSADTLRAWERRYEAVVPGRGDRGRLYSDADVARLGRLAAVVARGHAIGSVAGMSDAELDTLLTGPVTGAVVSEVRAVAAPVTSMVDALERYDLPALEGGLNRAAAVLPPADLIFEVVVPLMAEIGRRWESGRLRPAQEHLVSGIVRSVLGGLLRAMTRPRGRPTLVFATPSGERHELGLLCAALLAASEGFGVVYVGADVPADDVVHAVEAASAPVVVLSVTTPGVVNRGEARRLRGLPVSTELWIGGPEAAALIAEVGDRCRHLATLHDVVPGLQRHHVG